MGTKNVKRGKTFKSHHDPKRKRNPENLRYVLYEIEKHHFEGNRSRAARELTALLKSVKDKGSQSFHPASVKAKDLTEIIDDNKQIRYWHMSIFAEQMGVPTSILLLYAKFYSLHGTWTKSKADSDKNKLVAQHERLVETLTVIVNDMKEFKKPSYSDFLRWAQKMQEQPLGPLFE